jgi:hypothetical protein
VETAPTAVPGRGILRPEVNDAMVRRDVLPCAPGLDVWVEHY